MDEWIYYLLAGVIFAAGLLQSLSGFGFALLAVPVLTAVLPTREVVPLVVALTLGLNGVVLFQARRHVRLGEIWPLILAGLAATPLGAYFLTALDDGILKAVVGVVTCLAAMALLGGLRVKLKHERRWMVPIGFAGGLLGGSISLNGPPVVVFFAVGDKPKDMFRANLAAYFLVLGLVTVPLHAAAGLFTQNVLHLLVAGAGPLALGIGLGIYLSGKVSQGLFEKLVPGVILCTGAVALWSAVSVWWATWYH